MPDVDPFAGQPDPFAAMGAASPSASAGAGDPWAGKDDPFAAMAPAEAAKTAARPSLSRVTGQIGAGFNDLLAHGLGAPVDLMTAGLNAAHRRAMEAGLPSGAVGPEERFWQLPSPPAWGPAIGGSESIKKALGLIGANPDALPANTTPERIARGLGGGIGAAIAPELAVGTLERTGAAAIPQVAKTLFGAADSLPATLTNTAIGAGSGLGGSAAAELVPERWKPVAELAGGLAGGGIGAALAAVPRMAGIGIDAMGRYFEPLRETGQQAIAARRLAAGAQNPAGALDTLQSAGAPELVPGSKPTTFQATGDIGLGSMERAAETESPAAFNQRRSEQNAARVGALGAIEPNGTASLVPQFLKQHLADLDARTQNSIDAATTAAQARAAALPGATTPEMIGTQIRAALEPQAHALQSVAETAAARIGGGHPDELGAAMRGGLSAAKATAKADERALWQAVDPKGDLALEAGPISQAAAGIRGSVPSTAKPLAGEEKAIVDVAADLKGVTPFSDVTALRSRVTDAMREELRNNGETQTYRRLTQLRGAVEDAISGAVEGKAAQESQAVASGAMKPEETIAAKLQAQVDERQATRAQAAGGDLGSNNPTIAGGRASGISGVGGAESQARGGLGDVAGDRGLSQGNPQAKVSTYQPQPKSLAQYIARNGGLKLDPDAEHAGFNVYLRGYGKLAKPDGKPLDFWRERLMEDGYLAKDSDLGTARDIRGELFDALDNELRMGRKTHSVFDQDRVAEIEAKTNRSRRETERADEIESTANYIRSEVAKLGATGLDDKTVYDAAELLAGGVERDWERALSRAAVENVPKEWQDAAYTGAARQYGDTLGSEGESRGATGAQARTRGQGADLSSAGDAGDAAKGGLAPNFDQAARERLAAASAATKARAQTFNQGSVGEALRTQGAQGNFRTLDSAVGGKFFRPGPTGGQAIETFMRTVGNRPEAADALHNYVSGSLRRAAMREDGTLDPGRFVSWQRSHADALAALPDELSARFTNAADASRAAADFRPIPADMAPSVVPQRFFRSGPGGFDGVQELRGLIGDQRALDTLSEYAANRLRAGALDTDGTVNPAKLEAFLKGHAEAMRSFPALKAQFVDAAKATQTIGQAAAARKTALDDFQKGAIGTLLKVSEPGDVVRTVGAIFGRKDAIQAMREVAQATKGDPDAVQGLRKAIAEFIDGKFISNREAGTSGLNAMRGDPFQTFIRNNRPVLGQVFKPDEIKGVEAIADDLARSNRSIDAIKLPGRSNTAQDLAAAEKPTSPNHHAKNGSLLAQVIGAGGAGYLAHGEIGAVAGALGAAGRYVLGAARMAGMEKVDQLVQEMLLHPDLARAGLESAARQTGKVPGLSFAQTLSRIAAVNASRAALSAH